MLLLLLLILLCAPYTCHLNMLSMLVTQVREAIAKVQAGLLAADPRLEGCLLEPATHNSSCC
jgi:hypothetical protein